MSWLVATRLGRAARTAGRPATASTSVASSPICIGTCSDLMTGEDVIGLGVDEGPRVGQLMAQVEDWWEGGDFSADRDACLDKLKSLLAGE